MDHTKTNKPRKGYRMWHLLLTIFVLSLTLRVALGQVPVTYNDPPATPQATPVYFQPPAKRFAPNPPPHSPRDLHESARGTKRVAWGVDQ